MSTEKTISDLTECYRLIGATEAKKGFGCFTEQDSRFLSSMYATGLKHEKQLRAENERLKAELKSIDGALDDPRANLTLTTAEIIWEIKAELAEAKKDSERMVNALICMTGWTKEYALEKGWNRENASLIWSGIDSANAALDAAMKGK